MISRRNKTLAIWAVFLLFWAWNVSAAAVKGETADVAVGELTPGDIEEQLQVCIRFLCGEVLFRESQDRPICIDFVARVLRCHQGANTVSSRNAH